MTNRQIISKFAVKINTKMNKAQQYINELNTFDEHSTIEAKQCTDKIDRSVLEIVCAFSNEPDLGGGVIILGLAETYNLKEPYKVVGVSDPDKLQKDLASQCAEMFNHPVRPIVEPYIVDGKKVLVVTIAELDPKFKPLYFEKEKLPKGAWRRIGSTDQHCTEEDLPVFYTDADGFDKIIAEDTDLEDIDENAVRRYRQLREKINPDAEELKYTDFDLLRSLRAVKKDKNGEWRLTNAGLLMFGNQMALRREMPSVRVDYIRVSGTQWVPDPHHRFESIDMRGPFLLMVGRAFNAIADDLPRGFSLTPGELQAERPLSIPDDALREAIVNALMHQSLRVHRPIQIIRYSNRIEITNAGFSLKPEESLGEPGSEMRNPTIGSIFHETQIAEAKGTGIATMRRLMKEAGMMPPTFESDRSRNIFTTRILLHHLLPEEDIQILSKIPYELNDNQKTALIFLREVGAVDNITYRQLSGVGTREATADIKQLESDSLISMHGQGRRAYYTPTEQLLKLLAKDANATSSEPNATSLEPNATSSEPNATSSNVNVPVSLQTKMESLGKRVSPATMSELVIELCTVQPYSSNEIAAILRRSEYHIINRVIRPLLDEKKLFYTIPEMINHPKQKYTAIPKKRSETGGING